jgi:hypothetical protein
MCTPWTNCGDNEQVAEPPSSSADRECEPCPDGGTSMGPNAPSCTPSPPPPPGDAGV